MNTPRKTANLGIGLIGWVSQARKNEPARCMKLQPR